MKKLAVLFFALCLLLSGCGTFDYAANENTADIIQSIGEYNNSPYTVINNNIPQFSQEEITHKAYENYSELDYLNRCGVATACIGYELMPTEERGSIGTVKPSGWHTVKYDNVDGKYLYNRCHLIGFQLTGENANEQNLITGTRYMNVEGMLPFENMVADYIKETGNHVMYRVTPVFEGENLLASGVQMQALSVEDDGEGICFNVYIYNIQPDIIIDYSTGESRKADAESSNASEELHTEESYILNNNSKKIHRTDCGSVDSIKEENRLEYSGDITHLINMGYAKCKNCF